MTELKEVRIKLDQLADKLISRLKDRSRYKLNEPVYKKKKGVSFFEHSLKGLEKYHASLGRYDFEDQFPIILKQTKKKTKAIKNVKIDIANEIIKFYLKSLNDFCEKGKDPSTFGETVYCDADIIELLHERINLGRYVAQAKIEKNPELKKIKNKKELEEALRNRQREKEVIKKSKEIAKKYHFSPVVAGKYFKWIIETTIKLEVEYINLT